MSLRHRRCPTTQLRNVPVEPFADRECGPKRVHLTLIPEKLLDVVVEFATYL